MPQICLTIKRIPGNIMMAKHPQTEAYPILERLVQTQLYWNRCGAKIISIVYSSKEKVS